MEKIQILVVCRHEGILQTIIRLINNKPEWNASGVVSDNEAFAEIDNRPYKIVLLGSGISNESDTKLRERFLSHNPDIIIVQHYGGGSGLLFAEIYEAIKHATR